MLGAPLSSDGGRLARILAEFFPAATSLNESAANAATIDGDDAERSALAVAIANLVAGRPEAAVRRLESITPERRDATKWANLAVAEMIAGEAPNGRESLLAALVASDRALALDPGLPAPWFVRARSFEILELRRASLLAWWQFLLRDSRSPWTSIARAHIAKLRNAGDDVSSWLSATRHIENLSDAELSRLSVAYPQQARTYAEALYLPSWAEAVRAGHRKDAALTLHRVAVIAAALQGHSGESLLSDVIGGIRDDRTPVLAQAFALYLRGRLATRDHEPGKALPDYEAATPLFSSAGNPMSEMSECYAAIALIDLNRPVEARRRLKSLVESQRAAGSRHKALLALALYNLALSDAAEGSWSDALAGATDSLAIFLRLGEHGNAGMVEALIDQSYDFLGQRHLSWLHGAQALSLLAIGGDTRRQRITIGGLSRSQLRHGQWHSASVLIGAERLTENGAVPRDDCDMWLRLASAEYHLGHDAEWRHALADARHSAAAVADASIRQKLTADVEGVAGSLMRRGDARSAIRHLSVAIDFQEHSDRTLLLPELYLQRGRAYRDTGRTIEAQRDFDRGIQCLERQRRHVPDADLRAGIFDDAAELFDDAVSLALLHNDGPGAFHYVERGRARAMVEEIAWKKGEASLLTPISVGTLAAALPADSVLFEYQVLDDALAVFVVRANELHVVRSPVRRDVLEREVRAFVDGLIERHPAHDVEASSQTLFGWLIAPLRPWLSEARTVIVVPDSALQQLPFAALLDGSTHRLLIEEHVLLTAPSAGLYVGELGHAKLRPRTSPPASVAVFANPSLRGGPFEDLDPLPEAEAEARRVARIYGHAVSFSRATATVPRFLSIAGSCDVVHFAGHTVIQPSERWHSALLFAPAGGDRGLLTIEQIARSSLQRTRTVVLASCATMRGHTAGIEGVPSVARAFLVAGVPSVVGTLWDVDDSEAAPLMQALHERLVKGLPPAEALRAAQLEALQSPVPALRSPARWAAFAVLGSGR